MSKVEKVILKVLSANSDNNFTFDELRNLLIYLNFEERTTAGSHHIFKKKGIVGIINIQRDKGNNAKPYQVRQVREFLINNKLI